jgi:RNA polymerase sigma factor (sigma-70 family)
MHTMRPLTTSFEATTLLRTACSVNDPIDIAALKEGKEGAFRDIVAAYQDRVFNTCLGFLETRYEAEDVSQEVFIEVFRSIKGFRGDASISTWIYRIAVTKSLQEIRKKRRLKRFGRFIPHAQGENDPLDGVGDADRGNHPLAQLEDKERAEVLYAALGALPESQRAAFTLHKIEGLSYQEIAAILDATLPAVESLIHRAKTNLRKRLTEYYRKELS